MIYPTFGCIMVLNRAITKDKRNVEIFQKYFVLSLFHALVFQNLALHPLVGLFKMFFAYMYTFYILCGNYAIDDPLKMRIKILFPKYSKKHIMIISDWIFAMVFYKYLFRNHTIRWLGLKKTSIQWKLSQLRRSLTFNQKVSDHSDQHFQRYRELLRLMFFISAPRVQQLSYYVHSLMHLT